jgi:hypothetical protein
VSAQWHDYLFRISERDTSSMAKAFICRNGQGGRVTDYEFTLLWVHNFYIRGCEPRFRPFKLTLHRLTQRQSGFKYRIVPR